MKRTLFCLGALVMSLATLSSCSFLEVEELGKSDTDTFFSELLGLRTARIGLYNITYDFYDQYLCKYAEVAGDNLQSVVVGTGSEMYNEFNFASTSDSETSSAGYIWKRGYAIITNANTILSYTGDLKTAYPNDVDEIRRIEAEAYFLRALAHFDLVRCYAQPYGYTEDASHLGVPIADHLLGTDELIARSSVKKVYEQIVKDLNTAHDILGDAAPSDANYISGMACNALLARVYLYMQNYALAEEYADKVIPLLTLTPQGAYAAMFTGEEIGEEAIFRLTGYYAGHSLKTFYNYESAIFVPTSDFENLFRPDDVRRTLLYAPDQSLACMKYYDLSSLVPDEQFYHITVLRGSEMYLIRAEARCRQNNLEDAAADLQKIQARALGLSESSIEISYNTADELMELIKEERRKEFFAEGHRFFDLARWGDDIVRPDDTNSAMKRLEYPDYRYALPITRVEMDANSAMVQNEGY